MAKFLELVDDSWCVVCGKANPIGLRQRFVYEEDEYVTYFTPRKEHQGYKGIVHGGITSTLLDEIMARYAMNKGCYSVTAELNVKFRKPGRIGRRLRFAAKIDSITGRSVFTSAVATDDDGLVIATATGRMVRMCE